MKKLLIFALWVAIIAISAQVVSAQTVEIKNPLVSDSVTVLIDKIVTWLLGIGLAVSTIVILWSAVVFMTSGGSTTRVTTARQTLWYAIIGIVILLLAKSITSFVANILGV